MLRSNQTYWLALKAVGPMGKCFHSEEAAFLGREVREAGGLTKG